MGLVFVNALVFLSKLSNGPYPLEDPSGRGCFKREQRVERPEESALVAYSRVSRASIMVFDYNWGLSFLIAFVQPHSSRLPSQSFFTGTGLQPLAGLGALRGPERVPN